MKIHIKALSIAATIFLSAVLPQKSTAQTSAPDAATGGRERLLMDFGWRFAFGHATDSAKDFDPDPAGTGFSYFAKAGTAAGATADLGRAPPSGEPAPRRKRKSWAVSVLL